METTSSKNKRIAKNTLLLYFRMLFMMGISLYTSRIILRNLGVEDFGIYNVVGGIVSMFSILSGSLSAAITRFINFELGKNNTEKLKHIFSSSVTIQLILGAIIAILAETIGLWFLNNKMVIPDLRINAANWVFQFSILTFIINLISIPYNATIIAHEKMSAFAYISIVEAVFKLIIAYSISISTADKLITYSFLMCLTACIVRYIYGSYCKKHFNECHYKFIWDKKLLQDMFGFAGWNFIGASSAILRDQGGNIVLNLFCGPVVNAARGISTQVNTSVNNFVYSFMTAINPQITQSYSSGNHQYMMNLIEKGSRFSFYLLLLLSSPIIFNTEYILNIWLGNYPEHTINFIHLVLIFTMIESISNPLITAMLATGKIKNYQIVVGGLQMLNLPISYLLVKNNGIPEMVFFVAIFLSICCLTARLIMLKNLIHLDSLRFIKKVILNIILVTCISFLTILLLKVLLFKATNIYNFILLSCICIATTGISILFIGCNKNERIFIWKKISYKIKNKK